MHGSLEQWIKRTKLNVKVNSSDPRSATEGHSAKPSGGPVRASRAMGTREVERGGATPIGRVGKALVVVEH